MSWLWKLLGGRPMQCIDQLFIDRISGEAVNLYEDRLGRRWMANTRWALFRVPHGEQQ